MKERVSVCEGTLLCGMELRELRIVIINLKNEF